MNTESTQYRGRESSAATVLPTRRRSLRATSLSSLLRCCCALLALLASLPVSAAIAFVQVNSSDPETPETTVSVSFSSAQTAGNLNIVAIGWSDSTNQVESVTDSAGNTYVQAGSPAVLTGGARSEATYYAKNIVSAPASGNMVTVTFTGAAAFADVRVFEYSGLNTTNPLDGTAGGTGTSSSLATSSISTTNANDLLFYANDVETCHRPRRCHRHRHLCGGNCSYSSAGSSTTSTTFIRAHHQ